MARRDDPDRYDDEDRPVYRDQSGERYVLVAEEDGTEQVRFLDDVPPDPWEPDDDLTPEERRRRFLSTLSAMERRID